MTILSVSAVHQTFLYFDLYLYSAYAAHFTFNIILSSLVHFLYRAPEVIFQPSMLGVDQAGLAEIIEFILNKYPPDIQNQLVQVRVM